MPQPPLSKQAALEVVQAWDEARKANPRANHQTILNIVGTRLGTSEGGVRHRLKRAKAMGLHPETRAPGDVHEAPSAAPVMPVLPEFPSADLTIGELHESLVRGFDRRLKRKRAERWFRIRMPDNKPFGLCIWGDPHLDSPGANWPLLLDHARTVEETEGMYSICVGDLVDNWVGRLMRLYAESEITEHTAWRLVNWFLRDAGLKWLVVVSGNHDRWNQGGLLLREIASNVVHVQNEDARFILEAQNGVEWPIWVRHNFPGHSQWNTLHGMQRAAHGKEAAALYVCGHLHNWALHEEESASRGFVYWLARTRGYKYLDDHQTVLGHDAQEYGASIVAVCNPVAPQMPGRIRCFPDVAEAAEYLKFLRQRY